MATSIKVKSSIKKKIQKSFRLFDFHVDNKKDEVTGKMRFYIQMFGINEEGESCSITIDDYKPFFYIKVTAMAVPNALGFDIHCPII